MFGWDCCLKRIVGILPADLGFAIEQDWLQDTLQSVKGGVIVEYLTNILKQ